MIERIKEKSVKFSIVEEENIWNYLKNNKIFNYFTGGKYLFSAIKIVTENDIELVDNNILLEEVYLKVAKEYSVPISLVIIVINNTLKYYINCNDASLFIMKYKDFKNNNFNL